MEYLKIQPIVFGELKEKKANAIAWTVQSIERGANEAIVSCSLVWLIDDINSEQSGWDWQMPIDNTTLQAWGSDDSVIDNLVLTESELFIKL